MPDAAWKAFERYVARCLGGRRTGATTTGACDVTHPLLAIECKHTSSPPLFVLRAIEQAERHAQTACDGGMQIPVAIIHAKGTRREDSIVCMRMRDFEELYGKCEEVRG